MTGCCEFCAVTLEGFLGVERVLLLFVRWQMTVLAEIGIILSQFPACEYRNDRRPRLSCIRDSPLVLLDYAGMSADSGIDARTNTHCCLSAEGM